METNTLGVTGEAMEAGMPIGVQHVQRARRVGGSAHAAGFRKALKLHRYRNANTECRGGDGGGDADRGVQHVQRARGVDDRARAAGARGGGKDARVRRGRRAQEEARARHLPAGRQGAGR